MQCCCTRTAGDPVKSLHALLLLSAACLLLTAPVMAGVTTYREGGPVLTAAISGTNEFAPGQDAIITITVLNSGVSDVKGVYYGTVARDDDPTTAKMVSVGLAAGNAPIVIRSDPQDAGDIASQGIATVHIPAKITQDADMGEYQLPVTVSYTYLAASSQPSSEILQSDYRRASVTLPVTIKIRPQVTITVDGVAAENLSVGSTGYVDLTIRNTGTDAGKKATVSLLQNGDSPIVPVDSSVYIGDFPLGQDVACRYKVQVSANATKQSYPVDVAVTYENPYGDVVTSAARTAGVPVEAKNSFTVVSAAADVAPGSDTTITVVYRNTGALAAYHATARFTPEEPFTSSDNTAFLGDIGPGGTATARFRLATAPAAAPGNFLLDTEIRYVDAQDLAQVSDSFRLPVRVMAQPGFPGPAGLLFGAVAVVIIGIAAGYYLLGVRKKR